MPDDSRRRRWRFYKSPGQTKDEVPVAQQEFKELPDDAQVALVAAMKRYQAGAHLPGDVKSIGNGLLEIRIQLGTNPYRVLFFNDGPVHLAVLAIYKNQQKLPKPLKDKAEQRMHTWRDNARDAK